MIGSSFGSVGLALPHQAAHRVESVLTSGGSAGVGSGLAWLSLANAGLYRFFVPDRLAELSAQQFGIPATYRARLHRDLADSISAEFNRRVTGATVDLTLPTRAGTPLLARVGSKETWFAKQAARTLARRLPNAQALEVPGAGHVWNLQHPELFSATVRAWVRRQPLSARLRNLR
ncbi:pimeloyl-ACP methyl ester carboxylesterase [Deinobacterium chartae]|uniref:Pimeloyl-ACP methyl ester carboxylesterase n=1 Tax=Deinobacterium chartae TaxID=521158 RepID=A0A841I795_9DEIO|nr:alpha/beta hydrolase [Deinobacterium chartae]MBB6099695.1 pimeloyl-ACP methyl ester carboxylesterase [Deinobacterium chartae]